MELGMIGLGRMGGNMTHRLLKGGHRVVVYDLVEEEVLRLVKEGAVGAASISDLLSKLNKPCFVWLMVPAGAPTESTISAVAAEMSRGDTIVDGGNSYYKDSMRRAQALSAKGINFLDAGTSGGVRGLDEGYCLMVGGDKAVFSRLEPVLKTLSPSPEEGYAHVGPSGAGHFVKMVHNGIEYGLMEAYVEGFELMEAKREFNLDLYQIARVWQHGSVVRSWLLELTAEALRGNPKLSGIEAYVEDSGEGRWTVHEAIDLAVPVPVISQALDMRFRSRQKQPFSGRLLAALRHKFGGHAVKKVKL